MGLNGHLIMSKRVPNSLYVINSDCLHNKQLHTNKIIHKMIPQFSTNFNTFGPTPLAP